MMDDAECSKEKRGTNEFSILHTSPCATTGDVYYHDELCNYSIFGKV